MINTEAWVNYDEAMTRIRACGDIAIEQFVMRGITIVVEDVQKGRRPAKPIDMLYLVEILMRLFEQRETLIRVFNGEDLRWWTDDDENV